MVRIDPNMMAACAAGVIAALIISSPSAMADPGAPATPDPPPSAADGVPHLSSPDNLPPDTTATPSGQGHGLTYLHELWQAVQNQDISGKDAAILLLTQRPMDPNATPPSGLTAGPLQPPPADGGQPPAAPAPQPPN